MVGNMAEYPRTPWGESKEGRKARRLVTSSLRTMKRFDTVKEAQKQGYFFGAPSMSALKCPGLIHMRKHAVSFWGKLLSAETPQSLVWWCSSDRKLTLAAYMCRAPAKMAMPDTFNGLLQWHKHGVTGGWMTHLWLVRDPRSAVATCAPFEAFERYGILRYEPYFDTLPIDFPCSDTPRLDPNAPKASHNH